MIEKRGREQPKFQPTQDRRSQVKLMKALGSAEGSVSNGKGHFHHPYKPPARACHADANRLFCRSARCVADACAATL